MDLVIEDFKRKLSNVRTGRATVGLLDTVMVDYYGTPTCLLYTSPSPRDRG
jgi:ribosome recycling factor